MSEQHDDIPASPTLRDWFAGCALTGLLAYPEAHLNCGTAESAATSAYQLADAMLKAREVKP